MRQVNFDAVEAATEGSYKQLPPGAYTCVITSMEDVPSKEYVEMLVDVAVGEHAHYFSDPFYAGKPWAHRIVLSYKDTALGFLKGRLGTITACNPGFDAEAAWNGGNLAMFSGKAVGVVFRQEEYLDKKTGEFRLGAARPDRLVKSEEMEDPRNADPAPKMLKEDEKARLLERNGMTPSGAVDVYSADVPF